MSLRVPATPVRALRAVAATADQAATQAAMEVFTHGGNAVDAAIGANAAIAVTGPHMCGLGGDLFALVRTPAGAVHGLNASGRAGAGADAAALRADGHRVMPMRHDIRTATVPGCVDGWGALHERFGSLDLATVLAPAVRLAASGFPASPLLVRSLLLLDGAATERFAELVEQATRPGARVRRPGVALTLQAIGVGGREAFYGGEFGEGLLGLGEGWFTEHDLVTRHADWVTPLQTSAFGVDLHTIGPNSQGYLFLGAARLADAVGLPADADDAAWAHVLVEAAATAGFDRPDVLHDEADGVALLDAIAARAHLLDVERAGLRPVAASAGDTTYLCTADASGLAVSLIQSNASGFGTWLVEPITGINVHNRGLGFSLQPGHPAELAPGRRPPHTLCPAMATRDGALAAVFGTMGGDAQPQILLQVAARLFAAGSGVADAIAAGRWALQGAGSGFDTWTSGKPPAVAIEGQAPDGWRSGLAARGHVVADAPAFDSGFGHAHAIVVDPSGAFAAFADPRARVGSAAGL
jgi:gamma-glutamyltranspeptidase / glutathione hydrolase